MHTGKILYSPPFPTTDSYLLKTIAPWLEDEFRAEQPYFTFYCYSAFSWFDFMDAEDCVRSWTTHVRDQNSESSSFASGSRLESLLLGLRLDIDCLCLERQCELGHKVCDRHCFAIPVSGLCGMCSKHCNRCLLCNVCNFPLPKQRSLIMTFDIPSR